MRRKQGKDKNRISMKRQRREKGAEGEGYGKKEWERACNISPEICCIMMVVGYEDIIFIQLLIHKMKYKLMRSVIREGGEGRGREEGQERRWRKGDAGRGGGGEGEEPEGMKVEEKVST